MARLPVKAATTLDAPKAFKVFIERFGGQSRIT
jgi:hypothetical protein